MAGKFLKYKKLQGCPRKTTLFYYALLCFVMHYRHIFWKLFFPFFSINSSAKASFV